jgi:dienelactone hydrolase
MGEMISYASNGGTSDGYLASQADSIVGAPVSGVIVIQEWWGLVASRRLSLRDGTAGAGRVLGGAADGLGAGAQRVAGQEYAERGGLGLDQDDPAAVGGGHGPGQREA